MTPPKLTFDQAAKSTLVASLDENFKEIFERHERVQLEIAEREIIVNKMAEVENGT